MDKQIHDGWMDGWWMDKQTDKQIHKWMDGWMIDRQTDDG